MAEKREHRDGRWTYRPRIADRRMDSAEVADKRPDQCGRYAYRLGGSREGSTQSSPEGPPEALSRASVASIRVSG